MSDPDRINDTEPTGRPAASDEGPDADGDEATEPNDASRGEVAAASREHDTDDFLRWLPTLALGHRRRAELVERASSDGADFAAYACEGRPAAAGPPRLEPAVSVQTAPHGERPLASRDAEREAPTILTRERSPRRGWRRIGWAALGVAAAGAALAAWAERPPAIEKASRRGEAVATAPLPIGRAPTSRVEATESAAAPPVALLPASPTDGARTAADRRAAPSSAAASDAARKPNSAGAPRTVASSARRGAVPTAAAVPAKDLYFEAP